MHLIYSDLIKSRIIFYNKFNKSFFDELEGEPESIELDIERTLGIVKNIMSDTPLVVETKGNKLSIKKFNVDEDGKILGEKGHTMISYKEPEGEVMQDLPFEIKDGTPLSHLGRF